MTDIFTLGLKADTTDIDRGSERLDKLADKAEKAEGKAGKLREGINTAGKAIVAFGATTAAALGGITVAAANSARELENLARLSNLSTEEFQRTAFAAKAYGIEQDKIADVLKDTQDKVGDFLTTGAGPLVDFFETIAPQVGITADAFRGLNGKDALQLYVDSLEKANLSQSEMVFFMEAIANDATLLIPLLADGGAEMGRLGERAEELGIILDELDISNLNDFKTSLGEASAIATGLSNVVGATLAPFVTDLTDKFIENADAAEQVRSATMSVIEVGVIVAGVFGDAARVFEIAGRSLGAYAFTVDEELRTIEERLDLAYASYQVFARNFDLVTAEWVNSMIETATDGIEELANVFIDGINELIEEVEGSALGELIEKAGFELEKINELELEPPTIDTTGLQNTVEYWKGEQARLEEALTGSNEKIKNAWQDVLDLMAEPLPSQQFDAWFDNINKMIAEQRKLQAEAKKTGKTQVKTVGEATKAEREFNTKRAESEISDMKNVVGVAKQAFSERSKAREALNRAEQAFTAIELALSFKKSAANALEAISSAFAAPFPLNFAAGAAMIGIMAGLGLFSGSGGAVADPTQGRQDSQGTGTVLGDSTAKSSSISEASERLEDIQVDQLAELRGIRTGLRMLSSGIDRLAREIITGLRFDGEFSGQLGKVNTGTGIGLIDNLVGAFDPTGLISGIISGFSSTKRELLDSGITFFSQTLGEVFASGEVEAAVFADIQTTKKKWWGLSKSSSVDRELQSIDAAILGQMGDIFEYIGTSVIDAAELLGFETVTRTITTVNDLFAGEDFGDLFGPGDRWNTPRWWADRFQTTTETIEMGIEEALAGFTINLPEISFEGLNGDEIQAELEAVFSQQADLIAEYLVPSITEYQQVGEGAFDTLIRVAQEQAIFNDALSMMGVSLSDLSNVMQIDIAQAVLAAVGGVDEFTSLINSFVSEFYTEAEQFEFLSNSVTEAVESLGIAMFENRDQYREMIEGIDLTTEAGQMLYAALLELNPALDQYFDILEDNAAKEAAEAEAELAEQQRQQAQAAREAADATRQQAQAAREAADATRQLEQAANSAFSALSQSVRTAQRDLESQLKDELAGIGADFDDRRAQVSDTLSKTLEDIQNNYDAQRDAVQARVERQINSLERQADVVSDQVSALAGLSSSLAQAVESVRGVSRDQARGEIQAAIDAARRGVNLSRFDLSQAISTISNVDEQGFGSALEFAQERARTANQLTELKKLGDGQLSQAERAAMMIERQIDAVQSSGDRQIEALDMAQEAAEEEAQRLHDEEIANLDRLQEEAEQAAEQRFQDQYDTLQEQLDTAREQLDALLGIDSSVKSVEEALAAFTSAIEAALAAQQAEAELLAQQAADAQAAQDAAIQDMSDAIDDMQEQDVVVKPDFVGPRPIKPEAVERSGDVITGNFSNQELLQSIAVNSAKTAKLLDRWDGDGQPDVRTAIP